MEVFEHMMTKETLGPKRDRVSGACNKLHNAEIHYFHCPPSIFLVIESRMIRWAGRVAHTGDRTSEHRILVGKAEGERLLARPRLRWKDNNKMDLQQLG
jgi:hypothetical protein